MKKLKIRQYQASDKDIVWELHRLGLKEIGFTAEHGNSAYKDVEDVENAYLKNGDFIVGEIDGKVVAMGAIRPINEDVVEVKRMRIHPDFQRKGFGRAILKELEKRAKNMGFKKARLDTGQKNIKSNNFYQKMGYQETGRGLKHENYYAVFYEKEL